jgi:hypothetical protein
MPDFQAVETTETEIPPGRYEVVVPRDLSLLKCHIQTCIAALKDEDGLTKTRELAYAVVKLREAEMWIDEHLRVS